MERSPTPRRTGSVYNGHADHGWLVVLFIVAAALLAAFLGLRSAVTSFASEPSVRVRVVEPLGGPAGSRALAKQVPPPVDVAITAPLTDSQQSAPPVETPAADVVVEATTEAQREVLVSAAGAGEGSTPVVTVATVTADRTGLRIWVGGDSLSQFMGEAIYRRADGVASAPATFVGSGLMNSAIVDWAEFAASEMALSDPDVAVFVMGTNDAKAGLDLAEYRSRTGAMMDLLGDGGSRRVIWVGAPMMNASNSGLNEAVPGVNDAIASEAAVRPWVTYVSTWDLLSDGGAYAEWLPGPAGSMVRVRAGDGIHYTQAGGELVASAVLAAIR